MFLQRSFLLVCLKILFALLSSTNGQQPTYNYHFCLNNDTVTATTEYMSNLSSLLDHLSSKASLDSFYRNDSNGIYGLFLCRGDVSTNTCQNCVTFASQDIRERCPSNRSAIIWYDECMLRYSNNSFFGVPQIYPGFFMWNIKNNTSPDETNYEALSVISPLIVNAPDRNMMFGTDQQVIGFQVGYALVQCTRDIDSSQCRDCLKSLADNLRKCCEGKIGWRSSSPSCSLRYENYKFYQEPLPPAAPAPTPTPSQLIPNDGGEGKSTAKILIITALSVTVVAAALLGFFWYYSCRKKKQTGEGITEEILLPKFKFSNHPEFIEEGIHTTDEQQSGEMNCFRLTTLQAATNNFADVNKLGEGGFGPVYKGKLPNGKEIAVKRLSMRSRQGLEEFKNEVILIIKLQHKNLVRLLGYCLEKEEMLLVYEYMANTSLDAFLFDATKSKQLDWAMRANILNGTARGLLYLHEDSRLKIIHRDLKASNVLLDEEMNPKISDFGTARIFGGNQFEANTERVVGTYGYMAPEYALEGLFSMKSDVYSFGILMIEILSGKKNRNMSHSECGQSLVSHAWQIWHEGNGQELIDPSIVDTCPISEALRWIHIALLCVQDDPADRPTMSSVVLMLGSKSINLPQPSTPPYSVARFTSMSNYSSTSGTGTGTGTGLLLSDQTSTSISS